MDCGFLQLPAPPELETIFLERDNLLAILPPEHPLAALERVPLAALCDDPFLMLEKEKNTEFAQLFVQHGLTPNVHFSAWDDYAIMSMVENGLGISVLPELILRRVPYRIVTRPLDVPAYRDIALALRDKETASLAVKRFLEYLKFR